MVRHGQTDGRTYGRLTIAIFTALALHTSRGKR